jgi:hypothetical protein
MNRQQNRISLVLSALLQGAKRKSALLLAGTAIVLTATFLHAASDRDQSEHQNLAGTWIAPATPGFAPTLASFMSEGRVIFSRPVTVGSGPGTFANVSTGHGEWTRTGRNEFVFTMFLLSGTADVEFSVLVKEIATLKLNPHSDELTLNGTVSGTDSAGNPVFSFPVGGVYTRVVAGH